MQVKQWRSNHGGPVKFLRLRHLLGVPDFLLSTASSIVFQ